MDKLFGFDSKTTPAPAEVFAPAENPAPEIVATPASIYEKAKYLYKNLRRIDIKDTIGIGRGLAELDLGSPGPVEFLHKEARGVFLNNLLFDGAKIDVARGLNNNFLLTHSLAFGSSTVPASYSFVTAFMKGQSFINANIDTDANLSSRVHFQASENLLTKFQANLTNSAAMNIANFEADYTGSGYTATFKATNPNPAERATGQYALAYLQNITPRLALGAEFGFNRMSKKYEDVTVQYFGKFTSPSKNDSFTFTCAPSAGFLMSSYWRKLSNKMEVAAELQFNSAQGKMDAIAQVAAKLEFQSGASLRMQADSTGKVASILEERISPNIAVQFAAELDHYKSAHKIGLGLNMES